MTKKIDKDMVEAFSNSLYNDPQNQVIKDAIMKNGIQASIQNNDSVVAMNHVFSEEIKTGKVTNQKQSGRCWMFAALNTFTHKLNDLFNLKDFELSQNYTNFWDKFEKANYFLENILDTVEEPLDGRLVSWLLDTPQQDGGQWDMFVSLIDKYGVVPKQVMPETFHSSNSSQLNQLLDASLRKDAVELRRLHGEGKPEAELQQVKEGMLSNIYTLLVYALGEPPETFDFEFRDEDHGFHREEGITPHAFFEKYVGINLHDYVSVINAPTEDKPYGKTYTVSRLGNVIDGTSIKYLNVDMKTLKELAVKQIKDNESVWFGCDVGQDSNRKEGIMDTALFDYEQAFGFSPGMSKAERLDFKDGLLTHAMVLTGVNLVDNKPNRWKVENSWGEKVGDKGYFVMSDEWMNEYTYQVVVHKKYLSEELKQAWDQEPVVLKPWDPMGSLAVMK
ncbi:aminopeptidase [Sediminibacillus dalangtanensis]|uniref:Aminopeptidase n=1 Tax=Sediminibacillus dalangtanensis TaxID=2729421 RepID=A0ABX7VSZ3_9BACI|nr:C1 family peptidase [Sediminibacillus dalangtanensis]QTM98730.1 aminopeptidase [Sediminibacillus dalangtanensis]